MEFTKPIFTIPSTLTFYDSYINSDLGFCKALDKSEISVKVSDYTIGRFLNDSVSGTEFFDFKDTNGTQVHPFEKCWKQIKISGIKTEIFNIYKTSYGNTTYYNESTKNFETTIANASWYFTEQAASSVINTIQSTITGVAVSNASSVVIKNLVNDVAFPCSSFTLANIEDYL